MALNPAIQTTSLPLLQVDKLCFEYPKRSLFWDYSFRLGPGITWLRGKNGAGKTTLLKLLAGGLDVLKGEIVLNGINLRQQGLAYRQQMFWCSSDAPDFSWLTLQEFLDFHLSLYPGTQTDELNRHLQALGLLPVLATTINALSLGQHKKMYLALALALPVSLLLIDEPFNALDVESSAYLRKQLHAPQRLARQVIVLTSHLVPDVPLVGEMVVD